VSGKIGTWPAYRQSSLKCPQSVYCVEKLPFSSGPKNLGFSDTWDFLWYGMDYQKYSRSGQGFIWLKCYYPALVSRANDCQLKNEALPNSEFFNTISTKATCWQDPCMSA